MTAETNDLTELYGHLFATLRGLRDKEAPLPIEIAKAVCGVAEQMTAAARVEVDYLRAIGADAAHSSRFLTNTPAADETAETRELPNGVVRVVQHKLRG